MLYLDCSATTPIGKEIAESAQKVMNDYFGNPSSLHRLGVEAESLLQKARQVTAKASKTRPEEWIFTSGGTESNNLAIKGAAHRYKNRGNHLITTAIEHPSVYESFVQLEEEGYRVTYLPADENGFVRLTDLENALSDETILISIMFVNNEVGTIQPIAKIGQWLKRINHTRKIIFHVDAIQAIGKLPLYPSQLGIDLMSISAHKIYGPKGIGALYRRSGLELTPLIVGGGQESGFRSGTENVAFIVAMAKAVRLAAEGQQQNSAKLYLLRQRLIKRIVEIPGVTVSGPHKSDKMAPHIVHFRFPAVKSEVLVHALENKDIYVSSRSACSSRENKPSRVLLAMGCGRSEAASGIRVSYSAEQSLQDMDYFAEALRKTIDELL